MKKSCIILLIITIFAGLLTFTGCEFFGNSDETPSTTEITYKEPTVSISESVTFSFKDNTSTTQKTTKAKKNTTTAPTTKYVAPTTEYVAPTTEYVAPTTKYVAPKTQANYSGGISYSQAVSRKFTESDVAGVSADTIQSVINDIYAHHGYIFKTPSIKAYYESQSWYNGTTTSDVEAESSFNYYETYNKDFLAKYR